MSKLLKKREYVFAWFVFLMSGIVLSSMVCTVLGVVIEALFGTSTYETSGYHNDNNVVKIIASVVSIATGMILSIVFFILTIQSLIVRKVKQRLKQEYFAKFEKEHPSEEK